MTLRVPLLPTRPMDFLRQLLRSPDRARVIPYLLFVLPIYLGGKFGPESYYWFILAARCWARC